MKNPPLFCADACRRFRNIFLVPSVSLIPIITKGLSFIILGIKISNGEINMQEKKFYGTYFNKDAVLKFSRWAGILAWLVLVVYLLTSTISFLQFLQQFVTGIFYQKGMSIFDLIGYFNPYLLMPLPGVVYFFGLKFVEHASLILLDMEESARRAVRGEK